MNHTRPPATHRTPPERLERTHSRPRPTHARAAKGAHDISEARSGRSGPLGARRDSNSAAIPEFSEPPHQHGGLGGLDVEDTEQSLGSTASAATGVRSELQRSPRHRPELPRSVNRAKGVAWVWPARKAAGARRSARCQANGPTSTPCAAE
jgi:hypothetical protein